MAKKKEDETAKPEGEAPKKGADAKKKEGGEPKKREGDAKKKEGGGKEGGGKEAGGKKKEAAGLVWGGNFKVNDVQDLVAGRSWGEQDELAPIAAGHFFDEVQRRIPVGK